MFVFFIIKAFKNFTIKYLYYKCLLRNSCPVLSNSQCTDL